MQKMMRTIDLTRSADDELCMDLAGNRADPILYQTTTDEERTKAACASAVLGIDYSEEKWTMLLDIGYSTYRASTTVTFSGAVYILVTAHERLPRLLEYSYDPRIAQRGGAPHQRQKVSVSENIRGVGSPCAHP